MKIKEVTLNICMVALVGLLACSNYSEYSELNHLIDTVKPEKKFKGHVPNFTAEKQIYKSARFKTDPVSQEIWLIKDGDKHIALYVPGDKPYIDAIAGSPDEAIVDLKMPLRYHNATLLGSRLTTSIWVDTWGISGDTHRFEFSEGGKSITLTESQSWLPEGKAGREGNSVHAFTFRFDEIFGYVIDMDFRFESNENKKKMPEMINFMPPNVWNPWPGHEKLDYTVYSPPELEGYLMFANNLTAGDLSDNDKHDWGRGFEIKSGGFVMLADSNTWSPALFRMGNHRFTQRTCDVWLDQHNHVHMPSEPDADGFYRIHAKFKFLHLTPEMSTFVIGNADFKKLKKEKAVLIQIGKVENFENQPVSLLKPIRGLIRGWWIPDFQIVEGFSKSGKHSLKVDGISAAQLKKDWKHNYIQAPNIYLSPNTTYEITCWAKVEGRNTNAYILGDLYEWSVHDEARLVYQRTNAARSHYWNKLKLKFNTGNYDPSIDLRFMVEGEGVGYFDDFHMRAVTRDE